MRSCRMAERIQLPDGMPAVRSVPPSGSGPGVLVAHAEYDASAANLFWERTVAFLHARLDVPG